ncbi:hypothetical protein EMG21_28710 [Klebsiella pneumoniae]|nr:hypothetical protein EMG21_28710 [Klebsiella pneumoniae]
MTRYYRIDWDALNTLEPADRMAELARINTDIRRVTGAERARIVHRTVTQLGTQTAAATHLGMKLARLNQLANEEPTMVRIIACTEPAELYHHYQGQTEPQPCYIELDLSERTLLADYNAEIGNGIPMRVYHGLVRRYPIPALTAEAANRVMEQIRPLAERICSDSEEIWDGSNHVARIGDDAAAAEAEIRRLLGLDGHEPHLIDYDSDQVSVWDIDGATNGNEADEYNITATTTDDRLDEIEEEIRKDLAEVSGSGVAVLEGVGEYLRQLRDDAAEDATN